MKRGCCCYDPGFQGAEDTAVLSWEDDFSEFDRDNYLFHGDPANYIVQDGALKMTATAGDNEQMFKYFIPGRDPETGIGHGLGEVGDPDADPVIPPNGNAFFIQCDMKMTNDTGTNNYPSVRMKIRSLDALFFADMGFTTNGNFYPNSGEEWDGDFKTMKLRLVFETIEPYEPLPPYQTLTYRVQHFHDGNSDPYNQWQFTVEGIYPRWSQWCWTGIELQTSAVSSPTGCGFFDNLSCGFETVELDPFVP